MYQQLLDDADDLETSADGVSMATAPAAGASAVLSLKDTSDIDCRVSPSVAPAGAKSGAPGVVESGVAEATGGGVVGTVSAAPAGEKGADVKGSAAKETLVVGGGATKKVKRKAPAAPPQAGVDPWGMPVQAAATPAKNDPWSSTSTPAAAADPWAVLDKGAPAPATPSPADPWAPLPSAAAPAAAAVVDPWTPQPAGPASPASDDEFAELTRRPSAAAVTTNGDRPAGGGSPWDMGDLGAALTPSPVAGAAAPSPVTTYPAAAAAAAAAVKPAQSRSPHNFLGENSGLVNLDNLIGAPSGQPVLPPAPQANPFGWTPSGGVTPANPFQAAAPPPPSINQIRNNRFEAAPAASTNPWTPPASAANPFLS